jgi:hypothetical protein
MPCHGLLPPLLKLSIIYWLLRLKFEPPVNIFIMLLIISHRIIYFSRLLNNATIRYTASLISYYSTAPKPAYPAKTRLYTIHTGMHHHAIPTNAKRNKAPCQYTFELIFQWGRSYWWLIFTLSFLLDDAGRPISQAAHSTAATLNMDYTRIDWWWVYRPTFSPHYRASRLPATN